MKMNFNLMVFIQEIKLRKTKDKAYVINLEEYKSIGTHWMALYVNDDNGIAFLMQPTLTALELNIFQKKLKNS